MAVLAGSVLSCSESVSGSVSVADAVEAFRGFRAVGARVDVAACDPGELRVLTAGIAEGQRALDALLMRVGAADTHQEQGEDAVEILLGDGSGVSGCTARREADRARTAAGLSRVAATMPPPGQTGRHRGRPAGLPGIEPASAHDHPNPENQPDHDNDCERQIATTITDSTRFGNLDALGKSGRPRDDQGWSRLLPALLNADDGSTTP